MLFCLNFLVFGVNKRLSVHKLHLHRLKVLFENFQALLVLFNF